VTDAGGTHHGLAYVNVTVSSVTTGGTIETNTEPDGTYGIKGLAPGSDYTVCFGGAAGSGGSSDATGYADECFDNRATTDPPTPVTVTTGSLRAGVDAALSARTP
jgi:hypothetical protein